MKKVFKILLNIAKYFCLILFFLYLLIVVVQKTTNNNFAVSGYRVFTVVSESMVPRYQIGDILLVKKVDVDTIQVGDDVCYLGEKADFAGKVVTHSVKSIEVDENGNKTFITEGIANVMPDPAINGNQIYGKVAHKFILLSFVSKLLSNKLIFFLVIFVPIIILVIMKIIEFINKDDELDEKLLKKIEEEDEDK